MLLLPGRLQPEAVRMLRRVKQVILKEPKRVHMGRWLVKPGMVPAPDKGYSACKTVGCIGGWVEVLYRQDHPRSRKTAHEILGLLQSELRDLFYSDLVYDSQPQTLRHAKRVARSIDQFIEDNG